MSILYHTEGWTIRKVMGGGVGIFYLHEFFFFRPLLVQEFVLQLKPSARIFLDKYCFVCHLQSKKNYFTKKLLYFVGLMFTEPEENNCFSIITQVFIRATAFFLCFFFKKLSKI